jgi:hypothetical protein
MFTKKLTKQQRERFKRFYDRLEKINATRDVIVCYKEQLYSIAAINLEIQMKTRLGKEFYLYLEKIGLVRALR